MDSGFWKGTNKKLMVYLVTQVSRTRISNLFESAVIFDILKGGAGHLHKMNIEQGGAKHTYAHTYGREREMGTNTPMKKNNTYPEKH